jgi:DNA-binding GntR family transcriptional regulator
MTTTTDVSGDSVRSGGRRRGDLSIATYEQHPDAIVTLKLAPGAALIESELCERLHVSRTPMRATLQRLQQQGFAVVVRSGRLRRLIVSPLTVDDMRELFMMVGSLDGLAARLAAALDTEPRASMIRDMAGLNEELGSLAAGAELCDTGIVIDLDGRFHECYERAAAGPRLQAELRSLHARRARYVRVYTEALVRGHNVRQSAVEHEAIIDALRAGDAEEAERCAARNYRNSLERYSGLIAALGERGSW